MLSILKKYKNNDCVIYNNKMSLVGLFYNTQDIHKILIKQAYDDYINIYHAYKKKNPNYNGYYTMDEVQKLDEKQKREWKIYRDRRREKEKILIKNILTYYKNYPCSKIGNNRFVKEYDEYPYRLEQNLSWIITELD